MVTFGSDRPDPGLYGRSFADVYDDWYGDISDPAAVVDAWKKRFGPQSLIVEFGSGSGRLAAPLASAGFIVAGIDASIEMVARAPRSAQLMALGADMAQVPLASSCADGVLIAYNTLFNVAERDRQQDCLVEARRLLGDDGRLAIECFIATPLDSQHSTTASIRSADETSAVAIVSWRQRSAQRSQRIVGSHIEVRRDDLICRPWELYYRPPGELDNAAAAADLVLDERFADWGETTFDPLGSRHVSWYRPA